MYAPYFIRRWPQALSGSAEEVEPDNEGGSSERGSKMARYWGDLPHLRQRKGKPCLGSAKERGDNCDQD